jgi:hypothetical protein
MAITAKEAYALRQWAKNNPGLPPQMRKWNQLIDETIGTASGGFPTTTTTTTSSTTTTTTA